MAQLNPNFEIDFNDINSYEQIQLINDTQLAKENLLMHKAYKEPADDEIIRNQFSSFTFVDFCPKLFNSTSSKAATNDRPSSPHHQQYMLETFSDLFDRINMWLKINRDWRVISMETLIFDCASQFNHLKSSIHSAYLPRNMRGLRLHLSPTKSRFSGPQKIGCINVIPRKMSSQRDVKESTPQYETLDQILARLNDLLLTRPIEGRILSVETITLPIVNGYVNTETNYLMDSRLNALSQRIYNHANDYATNRESFTKETPASPDADSESNVTNQQPTSDGNNVPPNDQRTHSPLSSLIDTLRVYYEFGPRVCGLVNLIDFLPRFNLRQTAPSYMIRNPTPERLNKLEHEHDGDDSSQPSRCEDEHTQRSRTTSTAASEVTEQLDLDSTESLTRLIGRSLDWFENERKRVAAEGIHIETLNPIYAEGDCSTETSSSSEPEIAVNTDGPCQTPNMRRTQVNLKMCNLQICTKIMLKSRLVKILPQTALNVVQSRQMFHERPQEPIICHPCGLSSTTHEISEWCTHILDMNQPYELKFVRLAYVVPVSDDYSNQFTRSLKSLPSLASSSRTTPCNLALTDNFSEPICGTEQDAESVMSSKVKKAELVGSSELNKQERSRYESQSNSSQDMSDEEADHAKISGDGDGVGDDEVLSEILAAQESAERLVKEASLEILNRTNERHDRYELMNQLSDEETLDCSDSTCTSPGGQLIGQLTYRLFAPCQLVNSSSCFSINPVNSSNPLARRGSVVPDGGGSCSDNATPSTLLLPASGLSSESPNGSTFTIDSATDYQTPQPQQQIISFGAFFPALAHDAILHNNQKLGSVQHASKSSNSYRFATNEFEPVEAIRRRMEVYVTTNSMKVLAGETLVVNLSDHLSCLSNAIEQTIVKASFGVARQPSTWVSVYVLYAAVDEPHLPSQLLEQQKLRERLQLISEADEGAEIQGQGGIPEDCPTGTTQDVPHAHGEHNVVPIFDDDFNCGQPPASKEQQQQSTNVGGAITRQQQNVTNVLSSEHTGTLASTLASLNLENGSIRVEMNRPLSNQADSPLYNSAYERTVALPTQPDDHLTNYLEPVDLNLAASWVTNQPHTPGTSGNVWQDEVDLVEVHSYQLSDSNVRDASKLLKMRQQQQHQRQAKLDANNICVVSQERPRKSSKRRAGRARRGGEHSQCSMM